MYQHSEKREKKGVELFYCLVTNQRTGKLCNSKPFEAKDGNTSSIAKHLKNKHSLQPPPEKKVKQGTLDQFKNMPQALQKEKLRSWRE